MFSSILADTLIFGSWLFIGALGLTLIFGVLRILNFAHGSFYAAGAYAAASTTAYLVSRGVPDWVLVVALFACAVAMSCVLAPLVEKLVLRWFYGRTEVTFLFVTYALFLIMEAAIQAVWGVRPYFASEPYAVFPDVKLAEGVRYVGYDAFLILVAVLLGLFSHWLMKRTVLGHLTVVVIHNPEISQALGVNVNRIKTLMFSLGVFYAVVAGALTAPMVAVQPGMGINMVVTSFAVIVIGGLGSIPGAAIGALVVALARTISIYTMPGLELFSIYFAMTLVLILKPEGLFPQVALRRI